MMKRLFLIGMVRYRFQAVVGLKKGKDTIPIFHTYGIYLFLPYYVPEGTSKTYLQCNQIK